MSSSGFFSGDEFPIEQGPASFRDRHGPISPCVIIQFRKVPEDLRVFLSLSAKSCLQPQED